MVGSGGRDRHGFISPGAAQKSMCLIAMFPPARSAVTLMRLPAKEDHMSGAALEGKKIAIIAADMVEDVELVEPRKALEEAGAQTELVSMAGGEIQAFDHFDKGRRHRVDRTVEDADASEYDALMIPGGVGNPDLMRGDGRMVTFTRRFFEQGKPVAAICHGLWMLVEAGVVRGRTVTSWPTLETDIRNAGGEWVDEEVVVDSGLVTSRRPDDIPVFTERMIEEFAAGEYAATRGRLAFLRPAAATRA
jgi:deglycase